MSTRSIGTDPRVTRTAVARDSGCGPRQNGSGGMTTRLVGRDRRQTPYGAATVARDGGFGPRQNGGRE